MSSTSVANKIIKFISDTNMGSAEVADALNKTGVIPSVQPLYLPKKTICGPVALVFAANGSNYDLHKQLIDIPKNSVVIIFTENCEGRAVIGEMVCKFLFNIKKSKAIIVHGAVRDSRSIIENNFPVWAMGVTPIGAHNIPSPLYSSEIRESQISRFDGGMAVCDADGAIVIPQKNINQEFLSKLNFMKIQEAVWSYCIERLSWSTFETICEKKYLQEDFSRSEIFNKILILKDKG